MFTRHKPVQTGEFSDELTKTSARKIYQLISVEVSDRYCTAQWRAVFADLIPSEACCKVWPVFMSFLGTPEVNF